jgi:hypothetical protein
VKCPLVSPRRGSADAAPCVIDHFAANPSVAAALGVIELLNGFPY